MNPGLFAAAFWDLGLDNPLLLIVRGGAALAGGILGWFLAAPLCRLLVRAAFHRPVPAAALVLCRFAGAGLTAFLFFCLVQGFGGGFGFEPGPGGGPGKGNDTAGDNAGSDKPGKTKSIKPARAILAIELLGGDRYKDDERFYLLERKEPAVSLKEVEKHFQKQEGGLEVHIILTPESVSQSHGAVKRLRNLADKYKMTTQMETLP